MVNLTELCFRWALRCVMGWYIIRTKYILPWNIILLLCKHNKHNKDNSGILTLLSNILNPPNLQCLAGVIYFGKSYNWYTYISNFLWVCNRIEYGNKPVVFIHYCDKSCYFQTKYVLCLLKVFDLMMPIYLRKRLLDLGINILKIMKIFHWTMALQGYIFHGD